MPTVLDAKPKVAEKIDTRLEEELGKVSQRIRFNDLLAGAAVLAVLTLGYAVLGVLLDRWFVLPLMARQAGLAVFVMLFAMLTYRSILRPLQHQVNPRYAARKLESTAENAKNAVINWVDLKERDLPDVVRQAVGVKAADGLADANVHEAAESRSLLPLGIVAGLLAAVLVAQLVICKPTQFFSLIGRTFAPFSASATIASRTQITLVEPANGDVTVTVGDPLTITATIGGRVPDADSPDRVRLQYRHNAATTDYEELALEPGENNRSWTIRVPDYVIQNGFWYRVAAGDARTEEHRVEVRTKPLIRGYDVRYEYPAYLRMQPETSREPRIEAYRGTQVTLTVKTNRELRTGRIVIDNKPEPIYGQIVGEAKDTFAVKFKLSESGLYRVQFTPASGESAPPSPPLPIQVLIDRPPTVQLAGNPDEPTTLPTNGLLKVDGTIGDDFGIDTATLRLVRLDGDKALSLKAKKYQDGRSFRREADGTFPTNLEYKDSVSLAEITDEAGKPVEFKPGQQIEYWVEATDNCTEPAANVGKSRVFRVKLEAPVVEPMKKTEQEKAATDRKKDEANHKKQQDQRLNTEERPAPPQNPDRTPDQQQPKEGEPQQGDKNQTGEKNPNDPNAKPEPGSTPEKQPGDKPMSQPGEKPMPGENPMPQPGNTGEKPKPDDDVNAKAEEAQKELDRQNQEGGQGRAGEPQPKPDEKDPPPGEKKSDASPMPQNDPNSQQKSGEKQSPDANAGQPPAEPKGAGEQPKPDPKNPMPMPNEQKTDANAGEERPAPKTSENEQKSGGAKGDKPTPGAESKPQPGQQQGEPMNGDKPPPSETKPQPQSGGANNQPMSKDQEPGAEKPEGNMGEPGQPGQPSARGDEKTSNPNEWPKKKPEPGELSRETGPKGEDGLPPPKDEDVERLTRDREDLNSNDSQKRQQAEEKFDDLFGKKNREKLQQDMKDAKNNPDPAQKQQAQQNADELTKKAAQQDAKKQPTKEEIDRARQKAEDLASDDKDKREAAEKEFDNAIGKDKREQLQKAMQNAKNAKNPEDQKSADQKANELTKEAARDQKSQPSKEEIDRAKKQAEDLASDDPMKREAAEKELDKQIGKDARKELQQAAKDAKSNDPSKKQAGKKKLDEMAKEAAKEQKNSNEGRQPTKEEMEKFAKNLEDLNSKDEQTRKNAEQSLDDKIGKQNREQLQEMAKDLQSDDPKKAEEAKKKLEDLAKELQNQKPMGENDDKNPKLGGTPGKGQDGQPLEDDPKNRLKTSELRLAELEKNRLNTELQKKLGYTQEEFDKFLDSYRESVNRQREEVEQMATRPEQPRPAGPATIRVGESGKVESRTNGATAEIGTVSPSAPPPGFNDAQRKFAEEASKLRRPPANP